MKKIIHHIRHIRKQPEHIRRHILHAVTGVFGVILLALWVYSLGTNFTKNETQDTVQNDLKPLSALKANFVGGYKSITGEE
ncbi:hypothetical protein HYW73_03540 [Candidatus Nomurabacteria bacterium]|nr:hypothetical protein [Candidatus Nomurabacteria bacterium]